MQTSRASALHRSITPTLLHHTGGRKRCGFQNDCGLARAPGRRLADRPHIFTFEERAFRQHGEKIGVDEFPSPKPLEGFAHVCGGTAGSEWFTRLTTL